ncbi:MAG TPA: DNA-processing protein DprA [Candidatus Saccharimonadales bacterium]|jgi:DNA processing protein|nr:DNA-processing protein DprA [Candidatus Saccharimonadales bacterium]
MLTLTAPCYPAKLRNIADPPAKLYIEGSDVNELLTHPAISIVGSRKVSAYGQTVTSSLAHDLAKAGILIISGLALGVDSIAHKAALDSGGLTLAVLPAGLDRIYPGSHRRLAEQIVRQGGALVTEYNTNTTPYPSNFIARNRIVSALSDAVLITEAAERSGTLSTARFALEQGKDVLAVPGNITSPTSAGTNNLIKAGATPVTCLNDVLRALGLESGTAKRAPHSGDPQEQIILDILFSGTSDGAELLAASNMPVSLFNQTLTMLEIKGQVRPLGNNHWTLG